MKTPRVAFIGCGAVAKECHLPALQGMGIQPAVLVDHDETRTRELMAVYGAGTTASDYHDVMDAFDAAVVPLPNHIHEEVCCDLLRAGKHVLVEKPMARTVAECEQMQAAARESGAVLAVAHMRRFLHNTRWVKGLLDSGKLGGITGFDFREGCELKWPFNSDYFFRKDKAGGGVLIDTGAHGLDLLLWWLGDFVDVEYFDDDYGGVEANCEMTLTLASGVRGEVELSRTRTLRNTCIITCEHGTIDAGCYGGTVAVKPARMLGATFEGRTGRNVKQAHATEPYQAQLADWFRAIAEGGAPLVSGKEGTRCIRLIETCYQRRKALEYPWMEPESFLQRQGLGITT